MPRRSAGIVLYRWAGAGELEVLLVHPGGPFWAKKDTGAWSVPKGEVEAGEDERAAALRELEEETGAAFRDAAGALLPLGEVRQRSGKVVAAWALEGDLDAEATRCSTTVEIEWPPRSGRTTTFPEVDRAAWFALEVAREKLLPAQGPFLDRLAEAVGR